MYPTGLASIGLLTVLVAGTACAKAPITPTTLYSFGSNASHPLGGVINVGGTLYGATSAGGSANDGTVYAYDIATNTESVVYAFLGGTDGAGPVCELLNVGGVLWGTTASGGANNTGIIFAVNPATGAETVAYSFAADGGADGAYPQAALINVGGILYGTTSEGGHFNAGTVFSFDPATGVETPIYAFGTNEGDGSFPTAPLLSLNGLLYGTTYENSTAFVVNPVTGTEQVLYSFEANMDYSSTASGLTNIDGMLYGAARISESDPDGFIYSLNPTTGALGTVYGFSGNKFAPASPTAGLLAVNGMLYGTTEIGGSKSCHPRPRAAHGCGTVFSVNPATGKQTEMAAFGDSVNAPGPIGPLVKVGKTFYGVTASGGTAQVGSIYSVK